MGSLFGSDGWGREQIGLAKDDGVFDTAMRAVKVVVPVGLSPHAVTAVFFAPGADSGGRDFAYVQYVQHFERAVAEEVLLEMTTQELTTAFASGMETSVAQGITVVDDAAGVAVNDLAAAMKVPSPPNGRWAASIVALHIPNALHVVGVRWGATIVPYVCRYSVSELIDNSFLLIRNLRRTTVND